MTAYYEEPAFLQQKAFLALCDCIDRLTRRPGLTVPEAMRAGRGDAEAGALRAIPGLAYSDEVMKAAIKTPSYPVFRALFEGENAQLWVDGLHKQLRKDRDEGGGFHSSHLPTLTAEAAHLCALARHGVLKGHDLTIRALIDDSPEIDDLLALLYPQAEVPLVEAMKLRGNALTLMRAGAGGRHIHTLASLVREKSRVVLDELSSQSREAFENGDWREMALLMRIGLDLSSLADETTSGSPTHRLLLVSGSAHGQVDLLAREPDLDAMIARDATDAFYGLTRENLAEDRNG